MRVPNEPRKNCRISAENVSGVAIYSNDLALTREEGAQFRQTVVARAELDQAVTVSKQHANKNGNSSMTQDRPTRSSSQRRQMQLGWRIGVDNINAAIQTAARDHILIGAAAHCDIVFPELGVPVVAFVDASMTLVVLTDFPDVFVNGRRVQSHRIDEGSISTFGVECISWHFVERDRATSSANSPPVTAVQDNHPTLSIPAPPSQTSNGRPPVASPTRRGLSLGRALRSINAVDANEIRDANDTSWLDDTRHAA